MIIFWLLMFLLKEIKKYERGNKLCLYQRIIHVILEKKLKKYYLKQIILNWGKHYFLLGTNEIKEGYSICRDKYKNINYRPGEWIKSDEWDNNRWNACSHGIHFYLSIDRLFKEHYIYVERKKELFFGYYNDFIKERER